MCHLYTFDKCGLDIVHRAVIETYCYIVSPVVADMLAVMVYGWYKMVNGDE
jgi:hypothetical protein